LVKLYILLIVIIRLALLLHICEVQGSILIPKTGYH